jgi:cytochrome c2
MEPGSLQRCIESAGTKILRIDLKGEHHMLSRKKLTGIAAVLFLSLFAIGPALAGGWSVVTLDELPQDVRAGEPFAVRFMIRGHGISPAPGMDPVVQATHSTSNQKVAFKAVELADPGHYEAMIELPQAGRWRWMIFGYGEHPLPDLQVGQPAASPPAPQPPGLNLWIAAAFLTLLLAAAVGLNLAGRRTLKPWAWGLLSLPVLAAGLLAFNSQARSQEQPELTQPETSSEFAYGEALFVAKGCATCHTNTRIPARYITFNSAIGPELSAYPTTAEYLRVWLKDPSAIKPDTKMPDLGLSEQEIEGLIAFLIEK